MASFPSVASIIDQQVPSVVASLRRHAQREYARAMRGVREAERRLSRARVQLEQAARALRQLGGRP